MKICRFNGNRLGIVEGDLVKDVSAVLAHLPPMAWPYPHGDSFMTHLPQLLPLIRSLLPTATALPLAGVATQLPVANPSKIIGAPVNYPAHKSEAETDKGVNQGHTIKPITEWGLFLKATTAHVGPADGIAQRFLDRRTDHEIEFAVVIGQQVSNIPAHQALACVAGYTIGLDITLRGPEFQSFRKSIDSYAVLGPWMVTADEIPDPGNLDLQLSVNGQLRQQANTRELTMAIPELIAFASTPCIRAIFCSPAALKGWGRSAPVIASRPASPASAAWKSRFARLEGTLSHMSTSEIEDAVSYALRIMAEAGRIALTHFRTPVAVQNKAGDGRFDPVTVADRDIEALLRARLAERFPDHGIVGEEMSDRKGSSRYSWIIDPIDGTRSFISGLPAWGILLGLRDGDRCIAGLMHQPYLEEFFFATTNTAWLERRGEKEVLHTRAGVQLNEAILYCTHPDLFVNTAHRAAFERVAGAVRLMRYGGDCYSYCLLAMGQIDLVIEDTLQPYDIQPLIPIIESAGGVISTRHGGNAHNGGFIVAAANAVLHAEALALLNT
jgi:histidinol phosphatase-like enzyme (inositol monophosphatase family)